MRVVGATDGGRRASQPDAEGRAAPRAEAHARGGAPAASRAGGPSGWSSLIAVIGLVGTLVFGMLYATKSSNGPGQDPAVVTASRAFLTDFFNFNAKTVDADFDSSAAWRPEPFATRPSNSSIVHPEGTGGGPGRVAGPDPLSRRPVGERGAGTASVYAVVDQTYVNNKITSPQADVVRLVVDLKQVNGVWKISDVTVSEGATPAERGQRLGLGGLERPRAVGVPPGRRMPQGCVRVCG